MIKPGRLFMVAAYTAAAVGLIALFPLRPAGAQMSKVPPRIVRNNENPARAFVTRTETLSIAGVTGDIRKLYTVPAGKILVVDNISAHASAPPGEFVSLLLYGTSGGTLSYEFPTLQRQGSLPGGSGNVFGMYSPSNSYFDPGSTISLFADKSGTGCCATVQFQISGYLVDP